MVTTRSRSYSLARTPKTPSRASLVAANMALSTGKRLFSKYGRRLASGAYRSVTSRLKPYKNLFSSCKKRPHHKGMMKNFDYGIHSGITTSFDKIVRNPRVPRFLKKQDYFKYYHEWFTGCYNNEGLNGFGTIYSLWTCAQLVYSGTSSTSYAGDYVTATGSALNAPPFSLAVVQKAQGVNPHALFDINPMAKITGANVNVGLSSTPPDQKLFLHSWCGIIKFNNPMPASCLLDVYVLRSRKVLPYTQTTMQNPIDVLVQGARFEYGGAAAVANPSAGQLVGPAVAVNTGAQTINQNGFNPLNSRLLKKYFTVEKHKKLGLAPGASVDWKLRIKLNKFVDKGYVYLASNTQIANDNANTVQYSQVVLGGNIPGITTWIIYRIQGVPCIDPDQSAAGRGSVSTTPSRVLCTVTGTYYSCGVHASTPFALADVDLQTGTAPPGITVLSEIDTAIIEGQYVN